MPTFTQKARTVEAERRPSGLWQITDPPGLALLTDDEFRANYSPVDAEAAKEVEKVLPLDSD